MSSFCGLDFGTSNSTIGIYLNNACQLVPLEKVKRTLRSAIFCDNEQKQFVFGQEGIDHYLEGAPGRLLMALKTVLGSSLMEEKTVIFNRLIPFTHVLKEFLKFIKKEAETFAGKELTQVVMGRPVHFHDHDPVKDECAQNTLEALAKEIGFTEVIFQYEPIAAALAYEYTLEKEQLALIVDMGGGTSDFTIIRLNPKRRVNDRADDVLANCGIHIAGTNFDQRLSFHEVMPLLGLGSLMRGSSSDIRVPSGFYHDLTTWHTLNQVYTASTLQALRSIQAASYDKKCINRLQGVIIQKSGHHILETVERSKQALSENSHVRLDLSFIEDALYYDTTRLRFNEIINDQLNFILNTIMQTTQIAGVNHNDIDAIFFTGGSTNIPVIREQVAKLFPCAKVIQGDVFGSVGRGLTLDAKRKFQ